VLPLPAAGSAEPGAIAQVLDRAGDGLGQLRDKVAGTPGSAREHVSEVAGSVKQHTAGSPPADGSNAPLVAARPGAATAAVVGCLAIGGGAATYCIESGVNPIGGLAGVVQEEAPKAIPEQAPERRLAHRARNAPARRGRPCRPGLRCR
jgi:hypothetical protein